MKAAAIEIAKMTTPIIQVVARPARQLAMKYWPQRCSTMKTKKSWTLQKCRLLKNRPAAEKCHQSGPARARMTPLKTVSTRAAIVTTPKT